MPELTLRLDDGDLDRLRRLALVRHQSAEDVLIALLHAEADRILGPAHTRAPGEAAERLRVAMGWDRLPEMTPEQAAEFDAKCERAEAEAARFYAARRRREPER